MIKCPACGKPITYSTMSFKVSSGFLSEDGTFQEDITLHLHADCANDYLYNPFAKIELKLKDGEL